MPRLSVIIAARNCAPYLGDCIASLQNQTFADWEALICDDGSTDETRRLIAELSTADARIRAFSNDSPQGAGATRNKCLKAATGRYVAIQDADDVSSPDRFLRQVSYLDDHEAVSFVSTGMFLYDEHGIYGKFVQPQRVPRKRDFLRRLPYCHAPTMFRREALEFVNGYRVAPETIRGQDYDLFMRLFAAGFVGHNLPECLYGYREDKQAYRRKKMKYRFHEALIRYKGYRSLELLPWGIPYIFRPLLVGLIPGSLVRRSRASIRAK